MLIEQPLSLASIDPYLSRSPSIRSFHWLPVGNCELAYASRSAHHTARHSRLDGYSNECIVVVAVQQFFFRYYANIAHATILRSLAPPPLAHLILAAPRRLIKLAPNDEAHLQSCCLMVFGSKLVVGWLASTDYLVAAYHLHAGWYLVAVP